MNIALFDNTICSHVIFVYIYLLIHQKMLRDLEFKTYIFYTAPLFTLCNCACIRT